MNVGRKIFFGFEFLMVFAIVGFVAGLFLLIASHVQDRARMTAYMAYAEKMQRLVAGATASGYMDGYYATDLVCLGKYDGKMPCVQDKDLDARLQRLSAIPDPGMTSPYNVQLTPGITSRTIQGVQYFEVRVGISSDILITKDVCEKYGWGSDNSSYCYIHIAQTSKR